jgi:MFS family permease
MNERELPDERHIMRRVAWRTMPLATLIFLVSVIDRSNIGFAKLQMLKDLGMTEATYGFGASLFFIGYLLFEVPSALAVHRFGARTWLARITGTWGIVVILLGFTSSAAIFYGLRFLLGVAEAGAYPGIIYFITLWFPQAWRVRVIGVLMLGSALGNMFGALMGGALLDLNGTLGLAGWQWVFIVTGLPAIVLSAAVLRFLPSNPREARFLGSHETDWLLSALNAEKPPPSPRHVLSVLWDVRVLFFSATYTMILISLNGVIYWLPTVVRGFGVGGTQNGLLTSIPWAIDAVALVWLPRLWKREQTVVSAMAVLALIGLAGFFASTVVTANGMRLAAISIGTPCISLLMSCFWSLSSRYFSGARGAAAIGAISSAGNLGGFFAQNAMPWVGQIAHSNIAPMLVPAVCLTALGIGAIVMRRPSRRGAQATA